MAKRFFWTRYPHNEGIEVVPNAPSFYDIKTRILSKLREDGIAFTDVYFVPKSKTEANSRENPLLVFGEWRVIGACVLSSFLVTLLLARHDVPYIYYVYALCEYIYYICHWFSCSPGHILTCI